MSSNRAAFRLLGSAILLLGISLSGYSQNCTLTVAGKIIEKGIHANLPFSTLYVEELNQGFSSDLDGNFTVPNLCPGELHIEFSHIGYTSQKLFLNLKSDTSLTVSLAHRTEFLDEIVVHGESGDNSSQSSSSIDRSTIEQEGNKSLAAILESMTGVSTLKNGSGISKPVIHGLSGNRIAIMNNGLAQAGQQWGNDHAPEIDPYAADHLSVIKGASALAYPANSLGSVILVEPGGITDDPHLNGGINYVFQSNGMGHTLNGRFEKNDSWAQWRVTGTYKSAGDQHSPDYYLTNTGSRESNIAVQLKKIHSPKWTTNLYYSLFNTEIGVLRGAHIGNLTDLESAFTRAEPFFTSTEFSTTINAPKQDVTHHLFKLDAEFRISENNLFKFKYGAQLNKRKEFDVRRSGRSEIPSLSLNQYTHLFETTYQQNLNDFWHLKTGFQFNLIDNANEAGTGILPLIPRYVSKTASTFIIMQKEIRQWFFEAGGRLDFKHLDVTTVSTSLPREIEEFEHRFDNYSMSTGLKYKLNEDFRTNLNLGYMYRSPEINELYSYGLHQGVGGLEEGNRLLNQEKSLKLLYSVDWNIKHKIFVQALAYIQRIQDYIYLQPQADFRLTIRGAFPVFSYEQTDAQLHGLDLQMTVEPTKNFKIINKYAFVRGTEVNSTLNLIYMPADNFSSSLEYLFKSNDRWKETRLTLAGKYVFEQKRIDESQDFLAPPPAYLLLGLQLNSKLRVGKTEMGLGITVDNILNQNYRDYLNRLRYFSDEIGRNVGLRLHYIIAQ